MISPATAPLALTMPMLGWVAKDTTSYSFPVSVYGPQKATASGHPDVGNGVDPKGEPLPPGPPTRTSVPMPGSSIGEWVRQIRLVDARIVEDTARAAARVDG